MQDAVTSAISESLFDGSYERVHADLAALFTTSVFRRRETGSKEGDLRQAYDRLQHINKSLEPAREVVSDLERLMALHEWATISDVTLFTLLSPHYNLCIGTLLDRAADRPELADLFTDLESMSAVGVYLMTELGYGSNALALETEAVYDPGSQEFRLRTPADRARKYMPATGLPGVPKIGIVMARLKVGAADHGVLPFVTRIRTADGPWTGVHITALPDKPSFVQDNALTSFADVRVPLANLLTGPEEALAADGTFTGGADAGRRFLDSGDRLHAGRLLLATAVAACCRAASQIVVRYGRQRMTFAADPAEPDVPIMAYRNFRRPVFSALATTYGMTFLVNHTKRAFREQPGDPRVHHLLSVTKVMCTAWGEQMLTEYRERCGAQGMFSMNRVIDYLGLAHGAVTAEGDNQVMLLKAAGELLSGLQHEPLETAGTAVSGDLLDEDFWLHVLRRQELARREEIHRKLPKVAGAFFDAWNAVANDAMQLTRAHGSRVALERFLHVVHTTGDPRAAQLLRRLAGLFALTEIKRDCGWLLAVGILTPENVRALDDTIDQICDSVEPVATTLVEAFRIPAELLGAPIADDDFATGFAERMPASALDGGTSHPVRAAT